ncbi:MAG: DUF6491 family protein [Pseudomonas oryzihabitans]
MRACSTASALLVIVLLAGCAVRPFGPPTLDERLAELGYRQGAALDTILGFDLSGWHYLDTRHLALGTGLGRAYLVDFAVPCRNLAAGNRLGYRSRAAGLRPGDALVSTDARGSRMDCPIGGLYRLEPLR